jgi:hypothetical protein
MKNFSGLIHHVLKPLFLISIQYGGREVAQILREKHECGWKDDRIRRTYEAMVSTLTLNGVQTDTEQGRTLYTLCDIICAILDEDGVYGQKYFDDFLDILEAKGVLKERKRPYGFTV